MELEALNDNNPQRRTTDNQQKTTGRDSVVVHVDRDGWSVSDWDEDRIITASISAPPKICGVYFLIKDREIVYVGQSVDVFLRVSQHRSIKEFDSFSYIHVEREHLSAIERHFIDSFDPKLNVDMVTTIRRKPKLGNDVPSVETPGFDGLQWQEIDGSAWGMDPSHEMSVTQMRRKRMAEIRKLRRSDTFSGPVGT